MAAVWSCNARVTAVSSSSIIALQSGQKNRKTPALNRQIYFTLTSQLLGCMHRLLFCKKHGSCAAYRAHVWHLKDQKRRLLDGTSENKYTHPSTVVSDLNSTSSNSLEIVSCSQRKWCHCAASLNKNPLYTFKKIAQCKSLGIKSLKSS